eukprot:4694996-Amphidinium_carterae.1
MPSSSWLWRRLNDGSFKECRMCWTRVVRLQDFVVWCHLRTAALVQSCGICDAGFPVVVPVL